MSYRKTMESSNISAISFASDEDFNNSKNYQNTSPTTQTDIQTTTNNNVTLELKAWTE